MTPTRSTNPGKVQYAFTVYYIVIHFGGACITSCALRGYVSYEIRGVPFVGARNSRPCCLTSTPASCIEHYKIRLCFLDTLAAVCFL